MSQADLQKELSVDQLSDKEDIDPNPIRQKSEKNKLDVTTSQKLLGICDEFISRSEKKAREPCFYEIPSEQHPNWQPLACHFRNIEYTIVNLRTVETLEACLSHIIKEYLPLYKQKFSIQKERKALEHFLYDRLKSLRCELWVQSLCAPCLMVRILRVMLLVEAVGEFRSDGEGVRGAIYSQQLESEEEKQCYRQAMKYAIWWFDKTAFLNILGHHGDYIVNDEELLGCLKKKMKILQGNYIVYLIQLSSNPDIYVRFILWTQIEQMREIIIQRYKKARMNQKAAFLCQVKGYKKMDGWLDISKEKDFKKLQENKCQFDLQIKLWISEKDIFSEIDKLIASS